MEAASAHNASKAALKPLKLRQSFPAHDASSPRMACTRPQTSKTVCRFLQSRDNGFRKVAKRCLAALSEVQSPSIPNSSAPCPMALAHHLLRSGECQTFWQKESDPWIHSCMRLFKVGLLENGRFSSLVVACAQSRPTILMFGIAMSNVWVWSAARRTPRCKSLAKSSADAASVTMIETRCFNRCNKSSSTTPSALAEPRGGHFQGWQKCCMIWAVAVAMLSAEPSSACRPKEPETMVKSGNTALNRRRRLPLRSSRIRAKQRASESNFLLWAQIASDRAYLIRLFLSLAEPPCRLDPPCIIDFMASSKSALGGPVCADALLLAAPLHAITCNCDFSCLSRLLFFKMFAGSCSKAAHGPGKSSVAQIAHPSLISSLTNFALSHGFLCFFHALCKAHSPHFVRDALQAFRCCFSNLLGTSPSTAEAFPMPPGREITKLQIKECKK